MPKTTNKPLRYRQIHLDFHTSERIPGIGSLLIDAILANDTPVIMAVTFVFACLVVLFNLIADLLYGWLDPRISFS